MVEKRHRQITWASALFAMSSLGTSIFNQVTDQGEQHKAINGRQQAQIEILQAEIKILRDRMWELRNEPAAPPPPLPAGREIPEDLAQEMAEDLYAQ